MFRISLLVLISINSFVSSQRPEIVDEILPEVKQKNQIAYLNCTVINKDTGSAVYVGYTVGKAVIPSGLVPDSITYVSNSISNIYLSEPQNTVLWGKAATNISGPFSITSDETVTLQGNDETGNNDNSGLLKYGVRKNENGRRTTYTLIIRYLTEEDAGKYVCSIRLQGIDYEKWPAKIGILTVQIAPIIQTIGQSNYEADVGNNLTLLCNAYGIPSPNITWKREDGNQLPSGGFQSRGSQLQLTNIQKDDRGNYICVADNQVKPPDSYKVKLDIFADPSCRPVQDTVGQAQNRRFSAKLECIVAGYPIPSMRWEILTNQGWKNIIDDDKYDINKQFSSQLMSDETWYTLLIKNVLANDYTRYKCIGHNRFGSTSTEFVLFETMECQGPNCPSIGSGAASVVMSLSSLFIAFVALKFLIKSS